MDDPIQHEWVNISVHVLKKIGIADLFKNEKNTDIWTVTAEISPPIAAVW